MLNADTKAVVWTRMSRDLADHVAAFVAGKRLYLNPAKARMSYGTATPEAAGAGELSRREARPAGLDADDAPARPAARRQRKFGRLARIKLGR